MSGVTKLDRRDQRLLVSLPKYTGSVVKEIESFQAVSVGFEPATTRLSAASQIMDGQPLACGPR